ncbi:MAG: aspartyl protease family protein [Myxococcota bacterium]
MFLLLTACAGPTYEPWSTGYVHTVVPWVQDSTGHWLLVDTGTPRTQLRPSVVGGEPGLRTVPDWSVGEVRDVEVVVSEALPDPVLQAEADGEIVGLGGIVGADVLLRQAFWMDPRSERLWFGDAPPGIEVATTLAAEPTGDGETCLWDGPCFSFRDSRMIVDVEVNGEPLALLLDTAATYLMVDPRTRDRIGLPAHWFDFGDDAFEVGAADVSIGGLDVPSVAVSVTDEVFTESLVRLELEVDRPIDGVLGHTVLRRFVLGVDAPAGELSLSTYTSGEWDPLPQWVGLGFRSSVVADGCFVVGMVIGDSDASAAGIGAGDCVTAVDGLTPDDVDAGALMDHLAELAPGTRVAVAWDGGDTELEVVNWGR